jgi:hypothetical protein
MKNVFLLNCVSILFYSCAKDVKKGTPIRVSGLVVDTVKNKVLPFAKIYLVGGKVRGSNGVTYYYNYVDSTISDANGNYSVDYKAEGNSVDYVLEVANDNNYGNNNYEQFYFTNNATNVRLKTQELNFLKLNLKVDYNRYDTFYIYPSQGLSKQLIGRNIDTTLTLKVLPNNSNILTYRILYRGADTAIMFRRLSDTFNIGIADTTNISKRIISTYNMPLSGY